MKTTAPVILGDGTVTVLAIRWESEPGPNGDYSLEAILFRFGGDPQTLTQQAVDVGDQGHTLRSGNVSRITPDGNGGLLLALNDWGYLYRIDPDLTLSEPLNLVPGLFPRPSNFVMQVVVGREMGYALVQSWVYATTWFIQPRVVAFDPVTLTPLLTTYLDLEPRQHYLLHSISASGAAVVTGPQWANMQEVLASLYGASTPGRLELIVAGRDGTDPGESPYSSGNAQGRR